MKNQTKLFDLTKSKNILRTLKNKKREIERFIPRKKITKTQKKTQKKNTKNMKYKNHILYITIL